MRLRPYQHQTFEAVLTSLRKGHNPVASIPAGGGKSAVAAALIDRFRSNGGNTLLITHTKEILVQNFNTLARYSNTDGVGIFSAGLNSSSIGKSVTFGTIQSIYRSLDKLPKDISAIILDECHLISPKDSGAKMYNALMARFPDARRIGLSATPYRLTEGLVYQGDGCHFDDLAIDIKVRDLVDQGYLSPLVGISAAVQLDLKGVHKSNGDFNTAEVDERVTEIWLDKVLATVRRLASDRKAILLFTPTVRSAELAAKAAVRAGISAEYVHGGDAERDDRLRRWERGDFTLMANCQILTIGYDRPGIDCIVDCAPTESLGKHVQKLGRGTRIAPGKRDCLIIDVASNLLRLGGISSEADFKQESSNGVLQPGKMRKVILKAEKRGLDHSDLINATDPMAGNAGSVTASVKRVKYIIINSKKDASLSMVMCAYEAVTDIGSYPISATELLLVEHGGYARSKAESWFARRREKAPRDAYKAQQLCQELPIPRKIIVKKSGAYVNVVREIM